jgi:hypothetical protein
MRAAEIVEGALRQHAQCAAAAQHRLRDGIDGAVATRRDHYAAFGAGRVDGLADPVGQAVQARDFEQPIRPAVRRASARDRLAQGLRIAAPRMDVEDDEERGLRVRVAG